MFGLGQDPYQGQNNPSWNGGAPAGGPLANLQTGVASALNGNGNGRNVYIPGGPGEPIFQAPNPRYLFFGF